jgi:hypothetical protein
MGFNTMKALLARSTATPKAPPVSHLMRLPPEMRLAIYDFYIGEVIKLDPTTGVPKALALLRVCRLLHKKFRPVLQAAVRVGTKHSLDVVDFEFRPLMAAGESKRFHFLASRLVLSQVNFCIKLTITPRVRIRKLKDDVRQWLRWVMHHALEVSYAISGHLLSRACDDAILCLYHLSVRTTGTRLSDRAYELYITLLLANYDGLVEAHADPTVHF